MSYHDELFLNSQLKRLARLIFLYLLAELARPFARRPAAVVSCVLYIKPDHLGDLLLATPVLAALRRSLPEARIAALVGPWSEMTLRRNPDVDVLLTCPFPGFERGMKDDGRRTPVLSGAEGTDDDSPTLFRLSSFVFRRYSDRTSSCAATPCCCAPSATTWRSSGATTTGGARRWRCWPACRCGLALRCRSAGHSLPSHSHLLRVRM
jgi:hypothetical protein